MNFNSLNAAFCLPNRRAPGNSRHYAFLKRLKNSFVISFCGSSKICRNYTAKIAAVILLEKGSDNRVFPMKIAEKYRALLTGMAFHRWKEEEIDTAGNLAMDILSELPMYRLRNRADEESVEVIEKEIGGTLYDI